MQVDFSRAYTRVGSPEYDNFNNENGVFLNCIVQIYLVMKLHYSLIIKNF